MRYAFVGGFSRLWHRVAFDNLACLGGVVVGPVGLDSGTARYLSFVGLEHLLAERSVRRPCPIAHERLLRRPQSAGFRVDVSLLTFKRPLQMVDRNLVRSLESDQELKAEIEAAMAGAEESGLATLETEQNIDVNSIVEGRVIRVHDGRVLVDVGFKSEGRIPLAEWEEEDEQPQVGDIIKVLVEEVEDGVGPVDDSQDMVALSKKKAEKILAWQDMMKTVHEGQVVTGKCIRKIKGGLLVDIGVNVFLPASQVDIRRPHDIGDYISRFVQCEVLKIDEARRNIVVSRRLLIEKQRQEDREALLTELETGQLRKGIVKNIAEFGAFVDLGGIDGLLHITDMSHGRIGHPSEMVSIDEELEVMILNIDREKEKIALGLKQKSPSPWLQVGDRYPVGSTVEGQVVNVMSYGAFVKLEEGIEGLVHISEMSWTKRISHPSELVQIGDDINVVVLGIDQGQGRNLLGDEADSEEPLGTSGRSLSRGKHGQGARTGT